mmetsp:Transcript_63594/g.143459  ORF Transcript_63594/g.143459 Transcript_63594/m.143459 type:complete len:311 (-) Transcript_63594:180-1112(-)
MAARASAVWAVMGGRVLCSTSAQHSRHCPKAKFELRNLSGCRTRCTTFSYAHRAPSCLWAQSTIGCFRSLPPLIGKPSFLKSSRRPLAGQREGQLTSTSGEVVGDSCFTLTPRAAIFDKKWATKWVPLPAVPVTKSFFTHPPEPPLRPGPLDGGLAPPPAMHEALGTLQKCRSIAHTSAPTSVPALRPRVVLRGTIDCTGAGIDFDNATLLGPDPRFATGPTGARLSRLVSSHVRGGVVRTSGGASGVGPRGNWKSTAWAGGIRGCALSMPVARDGSGRASGGSSSTCAPDETCSAARVGVARSTISWYC